MNVFDPENSGENDKIPDPASSCESTTGSDRFNIDEQPKVGDSLSVGVDVNVPGVVQAGQWPVRAK
jgi:hypothetical protein